MVLQNHGSIVTTQKRFRRFYNSRTAPKPDSIKDIVKRFEENGTVVDTARPGPCQTMKTPNNIKKMISISSHIRYSPTEAIYSPEEKRLTFAKLIAGKVEKKEIDIGNIDWSDEAHFHLSGHVNKQNMRIWGKEKPDPLDSKPLTQEKVTV
ncbi:Histone-lysine N-methyltransferase SETMAR [Oopsacas minuta]|uniref:Histone-lysine N-methyltransferase SETMAR n=1 Tax=Oopsacas minuta TaxID=111878 RepID=A0AAV7JVZ6_9METZ|nr:Histone-lysine N-methyltransferase SETMAR [Oopsacas minuta]KAI6653110.1 Histone-lysine N-methyltransferase SETMAR [Oopsacas minuta]